MSHEESNENDEETEEQWMRFTNEEGVKIIGGNLNWYGIAFMQETINGAQMYDDLKVKGDATDRDWRIYTLVGNGCSEVAQPRDVTCST